MSNGIGDRSLSSSGSMESLLPKALLLAGIAYPFWYFLTPSGARDWWPLWWLVALLMVLPQALDWWLPATRPHTRSLCHVALGALATQFVWLASVNDMHPFYAVSSVATGVNCAVPMSSRRSLGVYAAYIVLLTATSFVWSPHLLKIAYWAPLYVILTFAYWQLSARLRAESLVLRHQEELEQLVAERTANLLERSRDLAASNTRLVREIHDREQAEAKLRNWQKLEALARLAGGVAHDFNNVLTTITGFGELLLDRLPRGSSERRDTEEICRAAERAADLTRNLLAFSRQETFEVKPIDLNAALLEARHMLDLVTSEDIEIVMDLAPGPARIRTNKSQLDQMLVNLALNARDAMPTGGALTFSTRIVDCDGATTAAREVGCRAQLSVRDTGIGMDEETAARIFDPFFTTKDVDRGTGLGLSAVYGFVQQTAGSIRVDSEPGEGAEFTIEWPCVDAPVAERMAPKAWQIASASSPKQILVVDDDPSLLRVVSRVLEDEGYEVYSASDSDAALRAMQDESVDIDLLLTDVVMPRVSGMDLADEVSKLKPQLPILFMSGHLDHPTFGRRELPPGGTLLSKPFPPAELIAQVRSAFEESNDAGQSAPSLPC